MSSSENTESGTPATGDDDGPRFWVVNSVDRKSGNGPEQWQRDGLLVGVVDEKNGGIIAYCHHGMVDRLLRAFELQAQVVDREG